METAKLFIEFWSLKDPNVNWVLAGSLLLGLCAGALGCFLFLQKRSLMGDALAHAALPGVTSVFMLFGSRDPLVIICGALASCLAGYMCVEYLVRKSRINEDSALAIVLSLFFALGVFQLTRIQKSPIGQQAGLDKLLFGQAAALGHDDVVVLSTIALVLIAYVAIFFQKLKIVTFDRNFAAALGVRVSLYELSIALAVVLSVVIGLQLVGVVLVAALLLTPPAAARYWSDNLKVIVPLAGFFGAFAGALGTNVSYIAPRMPTGPWMVVAITTIFLVSCLFAPKRGVVARYYRQWRINGMMVQENILRTLFKLGEDHGDFGLPITLRKIMARRALSLGRANAGLRKLLKRGLIAESGAGFRLTKEGLEAAEKITRYHRLWELYLSDVIGIAPDHVHADAEEVEHVLTPLLEQRLMDELDAPQIDPHGRAIPKEKLP